MKMSTIKRNSAAAEAGVWIDGVGDFAGVKFLVRGWDSLAVVKVRGRIDRTTPRKDRYADGRIKEDVALRNLSQVLHEAVLMDWSGIEQEDSDKPLKFDAKQAKAWLEDPDTSHFGEAVFAASQQASNQLAAAAEEIAGN